MYTKLLTLNPENDTHKKLMKNEECEAKQNVLINTHEFYLL